jgi:hypothetical protein
MKATLGLFLVTLGATGCATARTQPAAKPEVPLAQASAPSALDPGWEDSALDIHYTLGHIRRHIHMEAANSRVQAQLLADRTLLKENPIDAPHYREFLHKVTEFIAQKRNPAANPADTECRSPYTINFRSGKDTRILNGCRASEEGAFAHLVRESEFLIYSQQ